MTRPIEYAETAPTSRQLVVRRTDDRVEIWLPREPIWHHLFASIVVACFVDAGLYVYLPRRRASAATWFEFLLGAAVFSGLGLIYCLLLILECNKRTLVSLDIHGVRIQRAAIDYFHAWSLPLEVDVVRGSLTAFPFGRDNRLLLRAAEYPFGRAVLMQRRPLSEIIQVSDEIERWRRMR